jgi:murein L,D-transpeptidase YcbB/YkuD
MDTDRSRWSSTRFILATASLIYLATLVGPESARASADDEWWNTPTERSRTEMRANRERERAALRVKLTPEYRTNVPYVSQDTLRALSVTIKRYRSVVTAGGWPRNNYDKTLRINDSGKEIRYLRKQLQMTGDLQTVSNSRRDWVFDVDLREAVARFQMRHGLKVTGFLDQQTRHALSVPATVRLQQLEINLARLHELSKISKAQRYVLVNIPAYTLQAVEENSLSLQSKVVVGRSNRQTPSLTTKIRELNFYPFWRVPESISVRDLIPQIRKQPSYFYEQHFSAMPAWGTKPLDPRQLDWSSPDVFKLKFRQDPGPFNALGVLRLNMPNKDIVYLHDTPLKKLFNSSRRGFSSGCVRVQKILGLAAWLLKDQSDWSVAKVRATVAQGKSKDVKLKTPVPVHFVYVTAWATNEGTAHFRGDIYGRDQLSSLVAQVKDEINSGSTTVTP